MSGGGAETAPPGEHFVSSVHELVTKNIHTQNPAVASPSPAEVPDPQHLANLAVDGLLQASAGVDDVGWGYELHYLAHHPVHVTLLAVACAGVALMVLRGKRKIKQLKAEFLAQGVDLTNVDSRVDTLTYLKKMQGAGMLPLALEVCAMKQAETEVLFLGPEAVKKWKQYYAQRGIQIESGEDLDRVRKYVANLHHLEGCLLGIDQEAFSIDSRP